MLVLSFVLQTRFPSKKRGPVIYSAPPPAERKEEPPEKVLVQKGVQEEKKEGAVIVVTAVTVSLPVEPPLEVVIDIPEETVRPPPQPTLLLQQTKFEPESVQEEDWVLTAVYADE